MPFEYVWRSGKPVLPAIFCPPPSLFSPKIFLEYIHSIVDFRSLFVVELECIGSENEERYEIFDNIEEGSLIK